jgi:phage/plasmid-associated DNA primase
LAYEYEMQANSLAEFFDKFCELDSSNWISKSALYDNYKEFCAQANAVPKSQTQFNKFATKSLRLEESRKSVDGAFIRIFWGVQLDNVAFNEFTNPELLSSYQGATGNLPTKSLSIPALPALPALKEIIDRIVCNNIGGERGQKNQVNPVKAGTDSEKAGSNLVKKSVIKLLAIYIKQMIPKFIGMDGLTYGPYAPDEVASLPEIHAINLTEKGYARLV